MQIFKNQNGKLNQVKEVGFELEKHMQTLVENNLEHIFGLEFIVSEFQLNNLRIDSLAFDNEINSFVIIEYKKGNSYSVIDQGMSYLSLLLNNKADFVQQLAKKRNIFIDLNNIDWSQSKVIIIADNFNRYQKDSINFKDLPIELWECKKFVDDFMILNPIKAQNTTESVKNITKFETKEYKKINDEIKIYDESHFFNKTKQELIDIYQEIEEFLLSLNDNIEIVYHKYYIAFKLNRKNIIDIEFGKNQLKISLNVKVGEIQDIYGITRDVSNLGHLGNGDYEIKVTDSKNLSELKDLIRQTYKKLF